MRLEINSTIQPTEKPKLCIRKAWKMRIPSLSIEPFLALQQFDESLLQKACDNLCERLQQKIAANQALPNRYSAVEVNCENEVEELVGADVADIFNAAGYTATFRKDVMAADRETLHSDILVTGLARIKWLSPAPHTTTIAITSADELASMDEPFLAAALDQLCAELMEKIQRNIAPTNGIRYATVSIRATTRWERAVVSDVVRTFTDKGYQVKVELDEFDKDYYDLITVHGLKLKQSSPE